MKTSLLTIAIAIATTFGFSKSTFAATGNNTEESTVLTNVNNITEIEIHGNVELYLSSGDADRVKVYNKYYSDNALVQDENGVLRITSYTTQKLKVWVTVAQLQKLSVYDNADVRSFGKFSAIELDVKLYNTASAKLNMDAFTASVTLNDNTKAELMGNVNEGELKYSRAAYVNIDNLKAEHLVKSEKMHRPEFNHADVFAVI
ncbi:DUF2807 domain-containing protein [Mucilaginibacter sp. BJC16-A38]|uniref:DUF2807 domain-containing protein n=1 Tax=Mucilaginibacter phenanthrenivorans TaxID=1234842 RepID=UPI00215757BD|nr:DUF2807 domain-containing protein [Mucilaginibacter phenanthrenivorans]MCR8559350.1 DUF2807 domain-containing protein [Mucilaginibacter phenanthrenivorans]